jgi:hypothetical protein
MTCGKRDNERIRFLRFTIAVQSKSQVGQLRTLADAVKLTFERPLGIKQRPSMEASNVDERIRVTVHDRGYDRSAASVVR